jgi:hypothetical protein
MPQQPRSQQSFQEPRPGERPRRHPALGRPAVARLTFGPAGDTPLATETNLGLLHCPSLVGSLARALHLRLGIAQSREQLRSKDFGLLQALAKTQEHQPERQSTLSRVADAGLRQPIPETEPRQPRPQPQ